MFVLLAFIVVNALVYPLLMLGAGLAGSRPSLQAPLLVVALLLAHLAMLRWVERDRGWSFVWMDAPAATARVLGIGAVVGAFAIAVPSLLLLATGQLRVEEAHGGTWVGTAWRAASVLLPAALAEELMVRGYPLAVLREAVGWRWALVLTGGVFGVLHAWNPGAGAMSIGLVTLAGIFLGGIVLATGSLYAAALAHFTWNWTMAGVLHAPVSGIQQFGAAGYRLTDAGPDWLTGGQWGPEGGLGAALGMGAGLWFLLARPRIHGFLARPAGREER